MAEASIAKKEFIASLKYLDWANTSLKTIEGDNYLYNAQLHSIYGRTFFNLEKYNEAAQSFEISENYYNKTHQNEYSRDRFFEVLNLATIYAILKNKTHSVHQITLSSGSSRVRGLSALDSKSLNDSSFFMID